MKRHHRGKKQTLSEEVLHDKFVSFRLASGTECDSYVYVVGHTENI